MLEFYSGPAGVTLVWDSPSSSDVTEPIRCSQLCGSVGRYFILPVGDIPLPDNLMERACSVLEPESPGILRCRETWNLYSPAPGDVIRLWSAVPLTCSRAMSLAFGLIPASTLSVDLDAVGHNLRAVKRRVGENVAVAAVVKCEGYGLGSAPLARACLAAGADRLAVTSVREGLTLRESGIDGPLVVLNFDPLEARTLLGSNMEAVVYTAEQAEALAAVAHEQGLCARAHLKVDTGLGRYGVPLESVSELLRHWKNKNALEFIGLMTHLSHANEPFADGVNREQVGVFRTLTESLGDILPPLLHAANSAGLARYPEATWTMVRTGAALCGIRPYPGIARDMDLERVVCWRARVAQVRDVPTGRRVGYGGMFVTQCPSRIATVLAGYGDGFPGGMANRARVLVDGHSAPVVGAVSMDCVCVNLTGLETAVSAGDEVILVGGSAGAREVSGAEYVSPEEAAAAAGISAYELISRIGTRVCRVYRSGT